MITDAVRVNALIVDDEKKAGANLTYMLKEYVDPGINVVGIAKNTEEAEKQIHFHSPDVVFLDIEMPHENAFHFLERITPFNFEVVFITAYDEYAVKAFKLNAIDYILKPISINELKAAVHKLKEKLAYKTLAGGNPSYLEISNTISGKKQPHSITLKDTNCVEVIDFNDIYFIEAQSSYSKIIFLKDAYAKEMIMSNPLAEYEDMLPADQFYRIHRSYLINCRRIKKIFNDGAAQVRISDDFTVPVSRRRYPFFLEFLKNNHHPNA